MKKRFFAMLIAMCMLFSTQIHATDNTPTILSQASDQELLLFLDEYNIEIPANFSTVDGNTLNGIRSIIYEIEQNPNIVFYYGLATLNSLALSLKYAVNDYYQIDVSQFPMPTASHGLSYNTVYSVPADRTEYNCYAYALGRSDDFYSPGDFSDQDLILNSMIIYEIALMVKDDLKSSTFNYQCVSVGLTRPNFDSLSSGQTTICVRKGDNGYFYDFHFMKLFSSDAWRHKPGQTAILTYDYQPEHNVDWISETYDGYNASTNSMIYYGNIYFLTFKSAHNYVSTFNGNQYHSGAKHFYEYVDICTDCGEEREGSLYVQIVSCQGPPCSTMPYAEEENNYEK